MVSEGSLMGFFERPVSLLLIAVIVLTIASQIPAWKRYRSRLWKKFRGRALAGKPAHGADDPQ